jgi:hypothetical protein
MAKARKTMTGWVLDALEDLGGSASFLEISMHVWEHREQEIREIEDLLYEWQYELRWAAHFLRRDGILRAADESPRGVWELVGTTPARN